MTQATDEKSAAGFSAAASPKPELEAAGLVEINVDKSTCVLIGMKNGSATPTLEQRCAIARRLIDVGPKLPKYIPTAGASSMAKKKASQEAAQEKAAGVIGDPAEIQKAFEVNAAETKEHEAQQEKEAAQKQKEEKAAAKTRKKAKAKITAPIPVMKTEAPVAAKKKAAAVPATAKTKKEKNPFVKPASVPSGGFTKDNKPATSGELIRSRIVEHKMTDEQIAAEVRKLWPGRTTKETDVRWNRSRLLENKIAAPDPVGGDPKKAAKK